MNDAVNELGDCIGRLRKQVALDAELIDEQRVELALWRMAAADTSIAPVGTDVSTPKAFCAAQAKYAIELLTRAERAEARVAFLEAQWAARWDEANTEGT